MASNVDGVGAFLDDWNPPSPWKAIVKPLDSAGSDNVFLVESRGEAEERFKVIDGKVSFCLYSMCFTSIFCMC